MKPKPTAGTLSFRYFPVFLPLMIALGIFFLYYGSHLLVDIVKSGGLLSPKGISLALLDIAGNVILWSLIIKLWQMHWHFTFTPTHLIAVHTLRRKRFEVPWEAITRVSKLPRAWWARGGGGLAVSQIETADGQKIPFMTHLMLRYKKFLEELRARAVNCRSFDPYLHDWDR